MYVPVWTRNSVVVYISKQVNMWTSSAQKNGTFKWLWNSSAAFVVRLNWFGAAVVRKIASSFQFPNLRRQLTRFLLWRMTKLPSLPCFVISSSHSSRPRNPAIHGADSSDPNLPSCSWHTPATNLTASCTKHFTYLLHSIRTTTNRSLLWTSGDVKCHRRKRITMQSIDPRHI